VFIIWLKQTSEHNKIRVAQKISDTAPECPMATGLA